MVAIRADNKIKLGDVTLILNTKIEDFKSVNNLAIVVETPKAFKTSIKKGDIIIIHHNVFRVFYDIRGNKKEVDLILKMTCTFVRRIKYICIKIQRIGNHLETDVL